MENLRLRTLFGNTTLANLQVGVLGAERRLVITDRILFVGGRSRRSGLTCTTRISAGGRGRVRDRRRSATRTDTGTSCGRVRDLG